MPWTYADLKAADAALPAAPLAVAAAVTALNAQTVTLAPRDVSWVAIRDVLMNNFDWGTLVQTASAAIGATLPGGGTQTALIQASAIAIRECCIYGGLFRASDATVWARLTTAAGRLTPGTVGAITSASASAVGALRAPTSAVWLPPVTGDDVIAARAS